MTAVLAYVAAAAIAAWGVAHAVPTRQVLAGFGPISADNWPIVLQEWLAKAFTMWGIAAVVLAVTVAGTDSDARAWVYRIAAGLLAALAALTSLTGARTPSDPVQGLPGAANWLGRNAAGREFGIGRDDQDGGLPIRVPRLASASVRAR